MFPAITHSLELIADIPLANNSVRSTTQRFLSKTKPLASCLRNTTCIIQQQKFITYCMRGSPSNPPFTHTVVKRDIF